MNNASLSAQPPTSSAEPPIEKIEILSVSLLDEQRPAVNDLKRLARSLGLEFGWHYLLDLTWIISQLEPALNPASSTGSPAPLNASHRPKIMDAGAGTGIMQWYLAEQGVQVLSVDRGSRAYLPLRFRCRFHVEGMRSRPSKKQRDKNDAAIEPDLISSGQMIIDRLRGKGSLLKNTYSQGKEIATALGSILTNTPAPGKVTLYNQDLKSLPDVKDGSLDAVVAVSSLEHNPPDDLGTIIPELMRTLKPGGLLLATLCAAPEEDWFHKPSAGWCYSEASLRRIFGLPESAPSNYAQYKQLFAALVDCAELRDNLASFYFKSGDNGMPWGKWDPQYLPVGVCKQKT